MSHGLNKDIELTGSICALKCECLPVLGLVEYSNKVIVNIDNGKILEFVQRKSKTSVPDELCLINYHSLMVH